MRTYDNGYLKSVPTYDMQRVVLQRGLPSEMAEEWVVCSSKGLQPLVTPYATSLGLGTPLFCMIHRAAGCHFAWQSMHLLQEHE